MGYLTSLKAVLVHPIRFFKKVPLRGGFLPPGRFLILTLFLNESISYLYTILTTSNPPVFFIMTGQFLLSLPITLAVMVFATLAFYLIMRLLKTTATFEASFRAIAYSTAPLILGGIPTMEKLVNLYRLFLIILAFWFIFKRTSSTQLP